MDEGQNATRIAYLCKPESKINSQSFDQRAVENFPNNIIFSYMIDILIR